MSMVLHYLKTIYDELSFSGITFRYEAFFSHDTTALGRLVLQWLIEFPMQQRDPISR
jgi:hypothetical protein